MSRRAIGTFVGRMRVRVMRYQLQTMREALLKFDLQCVIVRIRIIAKVVAHDGAVVAAHNGETGSGIKEVWIGEVVIERSPLVLWRNRCKVRRYSGGGHDGRTCAEWHLIEVICRAVAGEVMRTLVADVADLK